MARFYRFVSRGLFALAIVFLILANLAAPELRAESSSLGGGTLQYWR